MIILEAILFVTILIVLLKKKPFIHLLIINYFTDNLLLEFMSEYPIPKVVL